MGIVRYYASVVRMAFSHSVSKTQDFLFIVITLAGAAVFTAKRIGVNTDLTSWVAELNGWMVAASVLGLIFFIRLALAPYWIWKQQNERLRELEKAAEQREKLTATTDASPATLAIQTLARATQRQTHIMETDRMRERLRGHLATMRTVDSEADQKRKLIRSARQLIAQAAIENLGDQSFRNTLMSRDFFYELRPHLSDKYTGALKAYDGGRYAIMSPDGAMMPPLACMLADELERLEKKWGL